MTVNAIRRKKKQLYDQLYKARKVEVNVGTFRHYLVQEPKTRPSVYHQPPSYSETLYKEDIVLEGLFDFIVFYSTSLMVSIFSHLNPLPSLTLQSARNLNVACRPKRSKALFFVLFVNVLHCVNETEALCCLT